MLSKGGGQKSPSCGPNGYITLAFLVVPSPQHGKRIKSGTHVGKMAT